MLFRTSRAPPGDGEWLTAKQWPAWVQAVRLARVRRSIGSESSHEGHTTHGSTFTTSEWAAIWRMTPSSGRTPFSTFDPTASLFGWAAMMRWRWYRSRHGGSFE